VKHIIAALSKHDVERISHGMLNLKIPSYIKRRPRGLDEIKHWKASEYRGFLLYFMPMVLFKKVDDERFTHFLLLSSAIRILCSSAITNDDLSLADRLLHTFVQTLSQLYGEHVLVFNSHSLLHLVDAVRLTGPLWATSAFAFESVTTLTVNIEG
jgi:hypothetical protein